MSRRPPPPPQPPSPRLILVAASQADFAARSDDPGVQGVRARLAMEDALRVFARAWSTQAADPEAFRLLRAAAARFAREGDDARRARWVGVVRSLADAVIRAEGERSQGAPLVKVALARLGPDAALAHDR